MARSEAKSALGGARPEDGQITLGVLSAIEADAAISQRALSSELGVALGLANAYLKRCVKKGFVKIHQVPSRRYAYFLTPQGFAEKARLTGEYLTSSLQFFRRARDQMHELIALCAASGQRRIALVGASEIAEIATLTAHDHDVDIIGVIDPTHDKDRFCGLAVFARLEDLANLDAVIVTGTDNPETLKRELSALIGADRVYVPALVQIAHIRKAKSSQRHQSTKLSALRNRTDQGDGP